MDVLASAMFLGSRRKSIPLPDDKEKGHTQKELEEVSLKLEIVLRPPLMMPEEEGCLI